MPNAHAAARPATEMCKRPCPEDGAVIKAMKVEKPQDKLLVLDVNNVLLRRVHESKLVESGFQKQADKTVGKMHIFLRPHARDFLKWCSEKYHIVVWSSAMRHNVQHMVELAFRDLDITPVAVLDQTDCDETGEMDPSTPGKPLMLKNLTKVWAHEKVSKFGCFGPTNTLLVDDSPYKAAVNPDNTAIHPQGWNGPDDKDPSSNDALGVCGDVRRVLAMVAESDDVPGAVIKVNGAYWKDASSCEITRMLRQKLQPKFHED